MQQTLARSSCGTIKSQLLLGISIQDLVLTQDLIVRLLKAPHVLELNWKLSFTTSFFFFFVTTDFLAVKVHVMIYKILNEDAFSFLLTVSSS